MRSGIKLSNKGKVKAGPFQAFKHISNMARIRQNNHIANIRGNVPNFFNRFPKFRFGRRRVLDLEEIPNSYLGLLEENILEENNVLEATTQGFFKKLFKKIGKVFKKIGGFFKKLFKKKQHHKLLEPYLIHLIMEQILIYLLSKKKQHYY